MSMEEDDIEMKDLVGHSEDTEDVFDDEGTSEVERTPPLPNRRRRLLVILVIVSLCVATFFGAKNFLPLEPEKKESENDESKRVQNLANCKAPTIAETQVDCFNDPCFHFKFDPKKDCDWVAKKSQKRCGKRHDDGKFVSDHCPGSCGHCEKATSNTKINESSTPSIEDGLTLDYEMMIVDGVDDKDVYCEDLSRYEEWHNVKISKDDGTMFQVVRQIDHDQQSFTQGLTYARGVLFESAGRYGVSDIRILDRTTALVEKKVEMPKKFFAEGMTYYKDTLVQITWKLQRGFVYNITNLEQINKFKFETTVNQGWGITWDRCKDELIVTDGSTNLHFWDPNTFKEIRRVKVTRMDGSDAMEMNEIEFWRGRVLANVWYEDVILVINPETGVVEKEYDFSSLWPKGQRKKEGADVLNGISISENPDELYVTGKLWNRMYTVNLLPEL